MPRNTVVNRRNVDSPFVRRTLLATQMALDGVGDLASVLSVSKASLVDTALRHLAAMDGDAIVELLYAHGHLTEDEYAYVVRQVQVGQSVRAPSDRQARDEDQDASVPTNERTCDLPDYCLSSPPVRARQVVSRTSDRS